MAIKIYAPHDTKKVTLAGEGEIRKALEGKTWTVVVDDPFLDSNGAIANPSKVKDLLIAEIKKVAKLLSQVKEIRVDNVTNSLKLGKVVVEVETETVGPYKSNVELTAKKDSDPTKRHGYTAPKAAAATSASKVKYEVVGALPSPDETITDEDKVMAGKILQALKAGKTPNEAAASAGADSVTIVQTKKDPKNMQWVYHFRLRRGGSQPRLDGQGDSSDNGATVKIKFTGLRQGH